MLTIQMVLWSVTLKWSNTLYFQFCRSEDDHQADTLIFPPLHDPWHTKLLSLSRVLLVFVLVVRESDIVSAINSGLIGLKIIRAHRKVIRKWGFFIWIKKKSHNMRMQKKKKTSWLIPLGKLRDCPNGR